MAARHESFQARDGESLKAEDAREVLSGAELIYDDGAVQTFMPDGTTLYVDAGRDTYGEWSVEDDGSFVSYWPPSFRARYSLHWRVMEQVVGVTFISHLDHSVFSGRFRAPVG